MGESYAVACGQGDVATAARRIGDWGDSAMALVDDTVEC